MKSSIHQAEFRLWQNLYGTDSTVPPLQFCFAPSFPATPFVLRGVANGDSSVQIFDNSVTAVAELSNTDSEITGILPAGSYNIMANVPIALSDGFRGGDYSFTFQIPEPSPACLLLMSIIPFFQLARKRRFRR